MTGQTIIQPGTVSEDDRCLQGKLQREVCNNLYLGNYPTGCSGTSEPRRGYRCELTKKDFVAKTGFLGFLEIALRNDIASSEGLNVKIAERCPSRKINL